MDKNQKIKECLLYGELFGCRRQSRKFCSDSCKQLTYYERQEIQSSAPPKVFVHPSVIELLVNATWEFAKSMLWPSEYFSLGEITLAKIYIWEYYEAIPAEEFTEKAGKCFSAYCERIMLAKKYVQRFEHRFIPHPLVWLNRRNPKGFAGTKEWYERNQQRQASRERETVIVRVYDPALENHQFTA